MRLWRHPGDPEPVDLEALGMVEVTIDFGDMAKVPVSKIRKALDTYNWRLTEHQEIRMMAHAAEKFLIIDAAINPLETQV